jgi:hypothetical protein
MKSEFGNGVIYNGGFDAYVKVLGNKPDSVSETGTNTFIKETHLSPPIKV